MVALTRVVQLEFDCILKVKPTGSGDGLDV